MRCEEVFHRLNARTDGELRPEEAVELDAHLSECAQCLADAEGLQAIDAELRRAFVPRREAAARLAAIAVAKVRAASDRELVAPQVEPAPRLAWGQALLAVAAGFLLAVAMFRPWQPRSVEPASSLPLKHVARLAVASGPVEVQAASQLAVFNCPPSTPIARDSIIRTGPTERCEISLEDGNALRLDCNTEVTLRESEVVQVSHGRLWLTCQRGRRGLEIQSSGGTITANEAAQFAIDCQPDAVRLIVVAGVVNVQTDHASKQVGPDEQVQLVQGNLQNDPQWRDALLETAWVNSVLALRSSEHPELVERVNALLSKIGAAKLSLLYEDELRRLGDDGVPPLLAYLASTRDKPNGAQRATAARIVADVAEASWIADLISLLTDPNADVRYHAARGLERLTGRDQGLEARTWQCETWASCEGTHQKWLDWWTANRDRYPAARREIPKPTLPPF